MIGLKGQRLKGEGALRLMQERMGKKLGSSKIKGRGS
jgi:hypothetical protein